MLYMMTFFSLVIWWWRLASIITIMTFAQLQLNFWTIAARWEDFINATTQLVAFLSEMRPINHMTSLRQAHRKHAQQDRNWGKNKSLEVTFTGVTGSLWTFCPFAGWSISLSKVACSIIIFIFHAEAKCSRKQKSWHSWCLIIWVWGVG